MTNNLKRYAMPTLIVAGIIILIYYIFDPINHPFPRCLFYSITGWECAGCGSQRMLHALLHGDFISAWHYNAVIMILSPILLMMIVAGLFQKELPRFYDIIYSRWIVWSVIIIILAWWILRNII